ncbi:unnamed protein product [Effrenium voratum]|uniref:Uncharacterized protein n=1 Tax=Effrenium voratum TaxID=2562239 RepID=A0AA36NAQ7_9DINO|nr:unnamed protein product [Effrenium voratum]
MSSVLQQQDNAACKDLCALADKHNIGLASLLPHPTSLSKGSDQKPSRERGRVKPVRATVDLCAVSFPEGLFINADGTRAAIHRDFSLMHRGVVLHPQIWLIL